MILLFNRYFCGLIFLGLLILTFEYKIRDTFSDTQFDYSGYDTYQVMVHWRYDLFGRDN